MDDFAADMIRYPVLRLKALEIVSAGYYNRHPGEYERGVATLQHSVKLPSPGSLSTLGIIKFLLIAIGLIAFAFLAAKGTNRMMKSLFRDKSEKKRLKKFGAVSPLVVRILKRHGTLLWGKNGFWSKKFHIITRSDRWLLTEGKTDDKNSISGASNCVEVSLRSSGFRVKVTRLNGVAVNIAFTCKNFSAIELEERVKEACAVFQQHEQNHCLTPP